VCVKSGCVAGECGGGRWLVGVLADRALGVGGGRDSEERAVVVDDGERVGVLGRETPDDLRERVVGS
jgi:hypothetical protein